MRNLIFIIAALILFPGEAFSCSIFSLKSNNQYYMAGNEDWRKNRSSVRFVSATETASGYAVFGVTAYPDSYPQIGINDKGLSVDWATVPKSQFKKDQKLKSHNKPLIPEIMRKCETVQDVI